MEGNKSYPSLPSKYVTLAQLQVRWLKEHEEHEKSERTRERKQKEKELQDREEQQELQLHNLLDERERQLKIRKQVGPGSQRHKTGYWSATGNRCAKQYRPKNSNDSERNRSEDHEKSEGKAEMGHANTDQNSKSDKLKKQEKLKLVKRRTRREGKKNYPSLRSNYVILAQIPERSLKEYVEINKSERKQKEKVLKELQEPEEQQELQLLKLLEERERQLKIHKQAGPGSQRHKTGSWSATGNRCAKQYRPKNPNDSENNRPEDHEKSEGKAEIGHAIADQISTSDKLKKQEKLKLVKRKPRGDKEERETTEVEAQTTMQGNEEVEDSEVKRGDEKWEINGELNDESSDLTMEVEEKFGALSMNSGIESDKHNGKIRRPNNDFHHRSPRSFGGRSHGFGFYSGRFRRQELQKPKGGERIWVRKDESSDGNVGEIETASASYNGSLMEQ